jgi:hypothetical protein
MKTFIVGLALFIVLTFSLYFQIGYSKVERTELALKNEISEAASGAVLMFDSEEYGDGNIVFDDSEAMEYVQNITGNDYKYVVHIFDDSLIHRQYGSNGEMTSSAITFPYSYTDGAGQTTEIQGPAILIEAVIDKQFYTLGDLSNLKKDVRRSALYVVEGR